MPSSISDSGDVGSANFTDLGGGIVGLTGGVNTFAGSVSSSSGGQLGQDLIFDPQSQPFLQGGVDQNVLQGGVDTSVLQGLIDGTSPLQGGVSDQAPLQGGVSTTGPLQGGVQQTQPPVIQAVKLDIHNTVVQPLQPCQSVPYLKLVFWPTDPTLSFRRDLRREVDIPVPKKLMISLTDFKSQFDGKVNTGDPVFKVFWYQILPVLQAPQDALTVNYTSVNIYNFQTAIPANDPNVVHFLDISQLPLTQISQSTDTFGGTMTSGFTSYPLTLKDVKFIDVDQSNGHLIGKDPVSSGYFTGP